MNRMGVASNGMQIPGGPDARAQFLMGMNMNMGMPQQMFVPQQQGPLPQHSQQHLLVQPQQLPGQTPHQQAQQAHNRIQEQAQTQMNNLRQQAVSVHQHTPKQQGQLPQQQGPHQSGPAAAAVAAVAAAAAAAASQPQSQDELNGNGAKGKQTRPIRPSSRPNSGLQQQFRPQKMANGGMSPMAYTGQMLRQSQNGASGVEQPHNQQHRNSNALQDYQMQLMLLEKQNKKRLDIARNSSAGDLNSMSQMQQVQQEGSMIQPNMQAAPPKASPAPSPVLNNKNLPSISKGKRGQTGKRNSKAGASSNNASGGVSGRNSVSGAKRENVTPLTPAADVDSSNKKRRSSSSDSPAKKAANSKTSIKRDEENKPKKQEENNSDIIEEVDLDKKNEMDNDEDKLQASSAYFHASLGGNDKMVSVDILGGANGENNFFNSAVASGMDDVDFEFNNFLDSADAGLNGSITGFNWGNPIEGGD